MHVLCNFGVFTDLSNLNVSKQFGDICITLCYYLTINCIDIFDTIDI